MKEPTVKGFRDVIHCGEDVERIRIIVYKKRRIFKKQIKEEIEWHKGYYPLRIVIEDSIIWGKGKI